MLIDHGVPQDSVNPPLNCFSFVLRWCPIFATKVVFTGFAHIFCTVNDIPSQYPLENRCTYIILVANHSHMETVLLILLQLVFVAYFVVFLPLNPLKNTTFATVEPFHMKNPILNRPFHMENPIPNRHSYDKFRNEPAFLINNTKVLIAALFMHS